MKKASAWVDIQGNELDATARRALRAVYLQLWQRGVDAEAQAAADDDVESVADDKKSDALESEDHG